MGQRRGAGEGVRGKATAEGAGRRDEAGGLVGDIYKESVLFRIMRKMTSHVMGNEIIIERIKYDDCRL